MKRVDIFTDGACSGNPGKGGWGAVLIYRGVRRELSEGYERTTNNRMELLAAIEGLAALKEPCDVSLYSDSRYLVDAVEKGWAEKWRKKGWKRDNNKPALNADLWEKLMAQTEKHNVRFVWVKGHAENKENQRCDEMARKAAQESELKIDSGYDG